MRSRDALFVTHDFGRRIRATHEAMLNEVASINGDELLNTSPSALAEYLADRHRIDVPVLNESGITVDQREGPVVVNTFMYQVPEVPGTWFDYYVPFEGEAVAFECRASRFSTSAPRGQITGNELRLSYGVPHDQRVDVGSQFANDLVRVKQHLDWLHEDAVPHNTGLLAAALQAIERRREKLLADRQQVASLGFPLRQRGSPQTYAVPIVRPKARISDRRAARHRSHPSQCWP